MKLRARKWKPTNSLLRVRGQLSGNSFPGSAPAKTDKHSAKRTLSFREPLGSRKLLGRTPKRRFLTAKAVRNDSCLLGPNAECWALTLSAKAHSLLINLQNNIHNFAIIELV